MFWGILLLFGSLRKEKNGFDPSCAQALNKFIAAADLYIFPMNGQNFTYYTSKGRKFSKIDKLFVNHDFVDKWSDSSFYALPHYLSDHAPIILKSDLLDYGSIE